MHSTGIYRKVLWRFVLEPASRKDSLLRGLVQNMKMEVGSHTFTFSYHGKDPQPLIFPELYLMLSSNVRAKPTPILALSSAHSTKSKPALDQHKKLPVGIFWDSQGQMEFLMLPILSLALFHCAPPPVLEEAEPPPPAVFAPLGSREYRVDQVEAERYLGLWYEYAAIPAGMQARCTATTAEYTLLEDGIIGVHNECRIDTLDGSLSQVDGTATPVDERLSHLKVQFFSNFSADYFIVELDGQEGEDPYEWAVVSTFNDSVLWILSRTPTMDQERYEMILDTLEARELPVDKLVETLHFE